MKKLWILLLLVFSLSSIFFFEVQASFRLNIVTRETVYIEGVRHTKIVGSIDVNGVNTRQVINYLSANPKTNSDIHIVVGDNYKPHTWGMSGLPIIIDRVHQKYEHFTVIGGVNGDFYDINDTGQPLSLHVRDYEVIQRGYGGNRNAVGFKENGDVIHGIPSFSGYELLVYNDEGQLKNKVPVHKINQYPSNDSEIAVYFDDFKQTIPQGCQKVVILGSETKINKNKSGYFGKGSLAHETNAAYTVSDHHFVICGHQFNQDDLITENDVVVIQLGLGGQWSDVRYAIGSDAQPLVINGQANLELNAGASWDFPAPRTAIGIQNDGTVFFVVVDGRNRPDGMEGVKLRELGLIMAHLGADRAYNLDGGGSSTIALRDLEEGNYVILNTPSDLRVRSVSNGVFFVKGIHEELPPPIPSWPDLRDQLPKPSQVFVDDLGILHFEAIEGSVSYSVRINGKETIIYEESLALTLPIGTHTISIRAKGGQNYKSSDYSEEITYQVYPSDVYKFLELFRSFARQTINP